MLFDASDMVCQKAKTNSLIVHKKGNSTPKRLRQLGKIFLPSVYENLR